LVRGWLDSKWLEGTCGAIRGMKAGRLPGQVLLEDPEKKILVLKWTLRATVQE